MAYTQKVIDRFNSSTNLSNKDVGALDKSDPNVGTGIVGAPSCGDVMKFQIRVDENGKVAEAKFKTFGCGSAIASSALAVEWVKGKSLDDISKIQNKDIADHLGLPLAKLHCSILASGAIKAAITDYQSKQNGGFGDGVKVDSSATAEYKTKKAEDDKNAQCEEV